MQVAVIGTGYVGTVTATCFAHLGHDVVGLEIDAERAAALAAGSAPFFEPGLDELLSSVLGTGRLTFTADPRLAVQSAEVIFLCVGTPPGNGGLPDLSQVQGAVDEIAPHLKEGAIVVNKSTVPVGCGNWVRTLVEESLPPGRRLKFGVVSNPEFLREGSAIADFFYPDRLVLGGENGSLATVARMYEPLLTQQFPGGRPEHRPKLFMTAISSAEMVKYAANAFLATKISFANEIAALCELVGADVREVLPAIGADRRIGEAFLAAGAGWGGSCFGKDVDALIATGLDYGHVSPLLRATVDVNHRQRAAIVQKLQHELKVLKGMRVAILGLAFKPDTDDLRDAPALDVARRVLGAGAIVSAYDPIVRELPAELGRVRTCADPYAAADRADAVILMTEWSHFTQLDPSRLRTSMVGDVVIDGRNVLDAPSYKNAGLRVVGVGW